MKKKYRTMCVTKEKGGKQEMGKKAEQVRRENDV